MTLKHHFSSLRIVLAVLLSSSVGFASPSDTAPAATTSDLRDYVKTGNHAKLREYAAKGSSLEVCETGWTPLMLAAANSRLDTIRLLVELGANLETKSPIGSPTWGKTAFMLAAEMGRKDAMKVLLELGADMYAENPDGANILEFAAVNDRGDIILTMKELGADLNRRSKNTGATALTMAADMGNLKALAALLEAGVDINQRNPHESSESRKTPSYQAPELWRIDKSQPGRWKTALMVAALRNRAESIRLLARFGADLEIRMDEVGATAMHFAASKGATAAIIALAESGAQVDAPDKDGNTPLHHAVRNRERATVQALLSAGANPNLANAHGITPMEGATLVGDGDIRTLMLWHGDKKRILWAAGVVVAATTGFIYKNLDWFKSKFGNGSVDLRKIHSARIKRALDEKRDELRKRFQSPFYSAPSVFSASEGFMVAPPQQYTDELIEAHLKEWEQTYLDNLAYEAPVVADDESQVKARKVQTIAGPTKPSRPKQKSESSQAEGNDLPKQPTWEQIYQTRQFAQGYQTLTPDQRTQLNLRLARIVDEGRYIDAKKLADIRVVTDQGEMFLPLYELRFHQGMRVYVISIDRKTMHLLVVGDKHTQNKDIAWLKSEKPHL